MFGVYDNFPENIHRVENFTSTLPNKKLQQKLIQAFYELNRKQYGLEEVGHPALHECTVIFEVGIADSNSFSHVDEEEMKKVATALRKKTFRIMDFFCAVRYYKDYSAKKTPLKFDYYMLRFVFAAENAVELRVFHERGPRYISPDDLVMFLLNKVNEASGRKVLKRIEPS
jgi:hypothetical protein